MDKCSLIEWQNSVPISQPITTCIIKRYHKYTPISFHILCLCSEYYNVSCLYGVTYNFLFDS